MWRLRRRRRNRGLACAEMVELVTDYLDGALAPDQRARVEQHLAGCDGCAEYFDQVMQTARLLRVGAVPDGEAMVTLPDDVCAGLNELFRGWMHTRH